MPSTPPLIDRISQKLGLNLRYFAVSGFWVTLRYILLGLLSLATSVAFARLATKELYGQYQFVFSLISLLSLLSLPGLNTVSLRGVSKGLRRTVIDTTKLSFKASWFVAAAALLTGLFYLLLNHQSSIGWSLLGASICLPFLYGPNAWYTYYEGQKDFRSPTFRVLGIMATGALWLVVGIWQHWPLPALLIGYISLSAVLTSLCYLEVVRAVDSTDATQPTDIVTVRLGLMYTLQKFSSGMQDTLHPLLIASLYGYSTLAMVSIAYTLINSATGLIGALSSTYFPLLLQHKSLPHRRIVLQNLVIGAILAAAYWLFVRLAFMPVYGQHYIDSFQLAVLLSGALALLPLRLYFASYLTAHHTPSTLTTANVTAYCIAALIFFILRSQSPLISFTAYFYTLQLTAVGILASAYGSVTSKAVRATEGHDILNHSS